MRIPTLLVLRGQDWEAALVKDETVVWNDKHLDGTIADPSLELFDRGEIRSQDQRQLQN